jgi:ribosomal protein L6P/L9E
MPTTVRIDNADSAKTRILLSCKSMELLKKVQIQIRNLRKPSAFKLQGIYLDDIFPKVKKFVK